MFSDLTFDTLAVPYYIDSREHEMNQSQADKYLHGLVVASKIKLPILLVLVLIAVILLSFGILSCKKYKKDVEYEQSLPGAFNTDQLGDTSKFQRVLVNDSLLENSRKRNNVSGSLSGRRSSDSAFDDILTERESASNDFRNER